MITFIIKYKKMDGEKEVIDEMEEGQNHIAVSVDSETEKKKKRESQHQQK